MAGLINMKSSMKKFLENKRKQRDFFGWVHRCTAIFYFYSMYMYNIPRCWRNHFFIRSAFFRLNNFLCPRLFSVLFCENSWVSAPITDQFRWSKRENQHRKLLDLKTADRMKKKYFINTLLYFISGVKVQNFQVTCVGDPVVLWLSI